MCSNRIVSARPEAVLFDLDGTLVETNIDFPLMRSEMLRLCRDNAVDADRLAGMDILAIVDSARLEIAWRDGEFAAGRFYSEAMSTLREIEVRHAVDTTEIAHARELVFLLQEQGIGVGIVTRNCRDASMVSLGIVDINPDVIVCREDTKRHKPDPEPVVFALSLLSASPERSVVIGDHIMDIHSGKSAGAATIGFLRESRPLNFFDAAGPDLVVRDLGGVISALIDNHS